MSVAKGVKVGTVMLIDDNEIDNLINQKMLESVDLCETILVHTGAKSALEFLSNIEKISSKGADDCIPDIIFLDLDMPLMDGFQFLEEYEKLSDKTKQKSKIFMLTSSINPQDLNRSKKSKYITKYLNKPLSGETMEKIRESFS